MKFPKIFSRKKEVVKEQPQAYYGYSGWTPLFTVSYDGEKNLGELGPALDYRPDYDALRARSWQSYYESEVTQTIINKFVMWVIGAGLKLQAEPNEEVLESEGIKIDSEKFSKLVEGRFRVFCNSKSSDYANMENLHAKAKAAFLNTKLGGDVLMILRYIKGQVKVQLIDGAHVVTPLNDSDFLEQITDKGNYIRNGIEFNRSGEHVAYYIRKPGGFSFQTERIKARSSDGLVMAKLINGLSFRLDNKRGMPAIATVLETLKKLERYKEATVGSAEERQKIVYFVEHGINSRGIDPKQPLLAKAIPSSYDGKVSDDIPSTIEGQKLADKVAVTTNKMTFNMTQDATLKSLESKNELYFKDFYVINVELICATIGIPPEVALSKYDSNFSASRAALKDWEHTIMVARKFFSDQYYQIIYNFWLTTEILKNKIQAPGYLSALTNGDEFVLDSYQSARFTGDNVPHIDPVKEVEAERRKLGSTFDHIPLTTAEASTEALNGGDFDSNIKQAVQEVAKAEELKPELPEPAEPAVSKT